MAKIPIDDISMNVETAGEGLPLVLLHGWFMNTLSFERQLDDLSKDFHVIVPDFRGHGGTPCPVTGRSFDRPKDIIGVMDGLGIEQAIISGHSMGGPIALQIALDYPERCLGIVLLGTGPGPTDRPLKASTEMRAKAEATAQRLLKVGTVAYFWETGLAEASGVKEFLDDSDNCRLFINILEGNNPQWLADMLRRNGCDVPDELERLQTSRLTERLGEIKVPVLYMVGSKDAVFMPIADLIKKAIPHTDVQVVQGATHMIAIDAAAEVNKAIRRFKKHC